MAERRMFNRSFTDSDAFLDMPATSQMLYVHLCLAADDDGFVNQIKVSILKSHASKKDFNRLIDKDFVIEFESGVIVITHWKIHNCIQKDRYKETLFVEEKSKLVLDDHNVYVLKQIDTMDTKWIQDGYKMDTKCRQNVSTGKYSNSKDKYSNSQSINQDKDKQNNLIINSNEIKFYCEILDEWLAGNQDFTSSGKLIDIFERIKEVISNKEYVTINDCEVSIDKVLKRLVDNRRLGYDKWEEILNEVDSKPIKNKPLYFLKSIYNAI